MYILSIYIIPIICYIFRLHRLFDFYFLSNLFLFLKSVSNIKFKLFLFLQIVFYFLCFSSIFKHYCIYIIIIHDMRVMFLTKFDFFLLKYNIINSNKEP